MVTSNPWGCGRGPALRRVPSVRLLMACVALTASLCVPVRGFHDGAVLAAVAAGWVAYCGTPRAVLVAVGKFGSLMFAPYLALVPVIAGDLDPRAWSDAWQPPVSVVAHGLVAMLITVSSVCTLTVSELHQAMRDLRLPAPLVAIVMQIVMQTMVLAQETERIVQATSVRAARAGFRSLLLVAVSAPSVWLPRVLARAQRVADAMELRGYGDAPVPVFATSKVTTRDVAAVVSALVCLAASLAYRWGAL